MQRSKNDGVDDANIDWRDPKYAVEDITETEMTFYLRLEGWSERPAPKVGF
jgi:hypothetical protein